MKLTVNGRSAYAYTGGKPLDPTLPCVVFVHGALNDHTVWTLLARWFAHHGHSVLAVDLPGHMRSDGPPLPDVEAMADWVLALLDVAGVKQAALVGHSMGSLISLELAGRAPERITRLVMVGTAYPMKVSPALLDTAREQPLKAIDMVTTFSLSSLANKPSYPGPGVWLHGGSRALMRLALSHQDNPMLFHHDFSACDRYANGEAAAAKLKCPAVMVLGAKDQMTQPRQAQALAQALKARIVTLPAGHSLMAEAPDGLLNALKEALRP
ncbi:alpha/beta fold hydrolase [Ideonella sp. BN130291]|uniref:alpha/beta fold hydrolase n=1 Tax=Ideonella sp. BN130291 TaxID=3112940 RepID=UPI002E26A8AB|nr:alpha/beta hydrolase [Ideonella sp. BN130291]